MKYKWPARVVGFVILGFMLAYLHAMYLGIASPGPGGVIPHRQFILIDDQQQTWVVWQSSGVGLRQYDLWPDASGWALEQGKVPGWVLRPALGRSTISRGFGWPLPALTGAEEYGNRRLMSAPGYFVRNGLNFIPTRLLAGIIVNSILFSIVSVAIVWAAAKTWSKAFARRGLCPFACENCGYDMKHIGPICPECGSHKS